MRTRDRVFALTIAIAFLISTVGVSAAVVWQIIQDNKDSQSSQDATGQPDAANNEPTNENALKGKPMDNFTPVAKVESLQVQDLEVGTGEEIKKGDTITFDYTGALATDGTVFESSLDSGQPATFSLNDLIKGWQEGIPGMKVGGKRRLLIPAEQAYGASSRPGIPANSDLVFDITIRAKQ